MSEPRIEQRLMTSEQRLSNSMVASSILAGPSTLSFQEVNSANADLFAGYPVTELFCLYGDRLIHVKIDTADLPKVLAVASRWRVANFYPRGLRLYAYMRQWHEDLKRAKTVYLHRVLTDAPPSMEVDHRNHDSLDNRRSCNLRVVTHQQNLNNRIDYHSGRQR